MSPPPGGFELRSEPLLYGYVREADGAPVTPFDSAAIRAMTADGPGVVMSGADPHAVATRDEVEAYERPGPYAVEMRHDAAAPAPLTAEERDWARRHPGLHRGLHAIALGLRSEGVREWNYWTNLHSPGGKPDRELYAAADLACQQQVWDRCINTSERTKGFMDFAQRFPMPHKKAVLARTRDIGLDPAYVYGLIRQESRFIMDARSGVGASGLMQVMPATAKWTAKKIGLNDFKVQQITDRDTNIAIGTGYLKLVLDDFAGSMPMAAAAYNAGPGRPRSWRGNSGAPAIEAAIWAENIPFNETRDYVKKVLANTTIYAAMISGKTQSLKARLGLVGPREIKVPENRDLP